MMLFLSIFGIMVFVAVMSFILGFAFGMKTYRDEMRQRGFTVPKDMSGGPT